MLLVLFVSSYKDIPPRFPVITTFDQDGGQIGRSLSNDCVLWDPDSYISSHHASIEFKDGKFYIKDISTNGVFINQSTEPLGTGNSAILNAGDCLYIGDYKICISFDSEQWAGLAVEDSDVLSESFPDTLGDFQGPFSASDNETTILPIPPVESIPEDWFSDLSGEAELGALAPTKKQKYISNDIKGSRTIIKEKPEWYPAFRREIERLSIGNIVFNPPSIMRVGTTDRVEVRISTDSKEKLHLHLKGRGEPIVEEIKISEFMKVTLKGGAFSINQLNEKEQIVASPGFTEWAWDVLPTTSGKRTLHLLVTAKIILPFGEERKDHPVIDRDISVLVNPVYSTQKFLQKYWKWVITAVLLPFIIWVWKTYTTVL